MKSILLKILKPHGAYASWLIFLTLLLIAIAAATGHLDQLREYLDTESLTLTAGQVSFSAWDALRALLVLVLLFWGTAALSGLIEHRIARLKSIKSSTRVLVTKVFQIALYVVAFLAALDIIGLDLTTLAVVGGALGIGIGFGLQKIASNFISGLILLLERTVEQDDLIELPNGTVGFLRKSGARFTLLETFDGREILVPNEDLMTSQVINWTLSNNRGRIEIPVGIAYGSDTELAMSVMEECARNHPASIDDPAPQCFLTRWGDSSVELVLLFWVEDVTKGRREPQSDVMLAISKRFEEEGITIPFPQRDIHIRTQPPGAS